MIARLVAALSFVLCIASQAQAQTTLRLWHAYTGAEERALVEAVSRFEASHPNARVEVLAVPFGSYASKLESSIAVGRGPDLFIDAHERLPVYLERKLLSETPARALPEHFAADQLAALSADHATYGVPLSVKSAVLFVNSALVPNPESVRSLEQLLATRLHTASHPYALVFESDNPYYLAGFMHAVGAGLLDAKGQYAFFGPGVAQVLKTLRAWTEQGALPEEPSPDLVLRLFQSGRALAMVGGPWLASQLPAQLSWRAIPIPPLTQHSEAPRPFVTIEALFSAARKDRTEAQTNLMAELSAYLAFGPGAELRATLGGQVIAASTLEGVTIEEQPLARVVREQAAHGVPMPTHPNMRRVWEPAQRSVKNALRGSDDVEAALAAGKRLFAESTRPLPEKRSPTLFLVLLGFVVLWGSFVLLQRARTQEFRQTLRTSLPAYAYVTHALVAVGLLVVAPLVVGALTSLYAGRGRDLYFVGLANYADILSARGGPLLAPGSFWLVLLVTLLWTAANLFAHVAIGVTLAMLLQKVTPGLSRLYRIILIMPWAVPNYVTALAWKGMFHRQLGAINAILAALGIEPVSWFAQWSTAFSANLATNAWLGFPFMMVVTLGALASIPKELYEAAQVDGASELEMTRFITIPMIRPMLAPAIAMGAVWTFNMFNVVFLVSGGEPDGTTEILVSEAYRWAFTRSSQYGYAAAYAVLIFGMLVLGTRMADRLSARRIA